MTATNTGNKFITFRCGPNSQCGCAQPECQFTLPVNTLPEIVKAQRKIKLLQESSLTSYHVIVSPSDQYDPDAHETGEKIFVDSSETY